MLAEIVEYLIKNKVIQQENYIENYIFVILVVLFAILVKSIWNLINKDFSEQFNIFTAKKKMIEVLKCHKTFRDIIKYVNLKFREKLKFSNKPIIIVVFILNAILFLIYIKNYKMLMLLVSIIYLLFPIIYFVLLITFLVIVLINTISVILSQISFKSNKLIKNYRIIVGFVLLFATLLIIWLITFIVIITSKIQIYDANGTKIVNGLLLIFLVIFLIILKLMDLFRSKIIHLIFKEEHKHIVNNFKLPYIEVIIKNGVSEKGELWDYTQSKYLVLRENDFLKYIPWNKIEIIKIKDE